MQSTSVSTAHHRGETLLIMLASVPTLRLGEGDRRRRGLRLRDRERRRGLYCIVLYCIVLYGQYYHKDTLEIGGVGFSSVSVVTLWLE